ncbi:MAG: hypothetical protein CM15mP18_2850 [Methanobacteriota archaeon]|nr:MAG: hypothetical protein CM15mP18_2850 [Euryarchaeota archaeon]
MNEIFPRGSIGFLVAFGIGWEERSFERLLNASKQMRKGLEHGGSRVPLKRKFFFRFDRFMAIVILFFILIALCSGKPTRGTMLLLDRGSS